VRANHQAIGVPTDAVFDLVERRRSRLERCRRQLALDLVQRHDLRTTGEELTGTAFAVVDMADAAAIDGTKRWAQQ